MRVCEKRAHNTSAVLPFEGPIAADVPRAPKLALQNTESESVRRTLERFATDAGRNRRFEVAQLCPATYRNRVRCARAPKSPLGLLISDAVGGRPFKSNQVPF